VVRAAGTGVGGQLNAGGRRPVDGAGEQLVLDWGGSIVYGRMFEKC